MATIQAGKSGTHARCRVRRVQALKGDEGPEKGQIPPELGSCHPSLPSPGIHTAQANSVGTNVKILMARFALSDPLRIRQ